MDGLIIVDKLAFGVVFSPSKSPFWGFVRGRDELRKYHITFVTGVYGRKKIFNSENLVKTVVNMLCPTSWGSSLGPKLPSIRFSLLAERGTYVMFENN